MLKRILIPLEDSEFNVSAIKYACFIAKYQNAEITAGVYFDSNNIENPLGVKTESGILWYGKSKNESEVMAKETSENLIEVFEKECKNFGVKYSVSSEIGESFDKFLEKSKFYDMIIIGFQSNFRIKNKKLSSNYLQKVLDAESTLVFVVPKEFKPIKNIFIAYDASASATRALHHFAHIAALSNFNIKIFMSSEDSKFAEECVIKAKDYLRSYGAKNVQTEWTKREISELLEFPYMNEFDTIVLGLHSRKRILDFFVGSVTKLLIDNADKSLFIGI